jgi:hypothetical protein
VTGRDRAKVIAVMADRRVVDPDEAGALQMLNPALGDGAADPLSALDSQREGEDSTRLLRYRGAADVTPGAPPSF